MIDDTPLNEDPARVQDFDAALGTLRRLGASPPQKLPAVLPGSLRPRRRADEVLVYDEANREWLIVVTPEPRRTLIQRLLRRREPMWWRAVEERIERALRARFN
jgi:hypothetical protein